MVRDPALVAALEERTQGRKLGRASKKVCDVWDIPNLELVRWKFSEYDYYSAEKAQLPVTARGLFTTDTDRILVRGYDKFFNIGEVHTTKLPFLASELAGPYYATVKENGYLVLVTGYAGKLVVTSKNGSGPCCTADDGRNYALVAREWVLKHLHSVGQTERAFADLLEQNDWTAAGELCDDSFEEHVLPYGQCDAGIYLNGLNHNTATFATEPPAVVQEIGAKFGFRRTEFVVFDDFPTLQEFLERGQQTGRFGTRDVEGFVVRAKLRAKNTDFFFKFKFDEPYLMYREWREVVKELVQNGASAARKRAMRSKHRGSALRFLTFAQEYLATRHELAEKLRNQNLGIIELRSAFFAAHSGLEGADLDRETAVSQALLNLDVTIKKVLLVTVATLGCGKSTVAQILETLAPQVFGHRMNDAMGSQRGQSKFANLQTAIMNDFFDGKDVVTLDRNNSSRQERAQVFTEFDKLGAEMGVDITYVCLNYLPEGPSAASRALTRERVYGRGDRHATVKLSELSEKGVNGIMCQFENRFQTVNTHLKPDDQFAAVVDLQAGDSIANARKTLNTLRKMLPNLEIPEFTDSEIQTAFDSVREHTASLPVKVKTKKSAKPKEKSAETTSASGISKKQLKKLRYFGVAMGTAEYAQLLELAEKKVPAETLASLNINPQFHVTLAHNQSHSDKFKALLEQHTSQLVPTVDGKVAVTGETRTVTVTGIAWSPRVSAFTANVDGSANKVAHITIGTAEGVPARDANKLFTGELAAEGIEVGRADFEPCEFANQSLYASP